jgi:hypothetical protein
LERFPILQRAAALTILGLGVLSLDASVSGVRAVDLVLKSQLGQSVEFNDNRDLSTKSKGDTYTFLSSLMFDAVVRTPTMKFAATVDLSYLTFTGPGSDLLTDAVNHGVRASIERKEKVTTYNLGGSWSRRDASTVQIEDIGFATVHGHVDTYMAEGGIRRDLNQYESIGWASRVTAIQFWSQRANSNAPDSLSVVNTVDWRRQLSPLTDVTTAVQFEWQSLDNASGTNNYIWRPTAGVQHRLTKQLTLRVSGGAAITTTTQDVTTPIPPATTPLPFGTKLGWLADALLVYKLKTTEFSFFAGRSVAPSALGDLQERSTISLSYRQEINPVSTLSLSGSFSHITAPPGSNPILLDQPSFAGNAVDVYTASVGYSYLLARDWTAQFTYRFTNRQAETNRANSNAVIVAVKHDLTLWHDNR